jgi:hypothetical protein
VRRAPSIQQQAALPSWASCLRPASNLSGCAGRVRYSCPPRKPTISLPALDGPSPVRE